jgi:low temperature requirement protein LtrA
MSILWQKPRMHENPTEHRKVSWLELFFDLVFVAVISELVHLLSEHPSMATLWNYLFLFIPAWWVWMGATYYNDRFETEGLDSRFFTFLLMIPVAGLAIFAHHMPHDFSLGYGLCYMFARVFIVMMWMRASFHEKRFRPVGIILITGYAMSIVLFIVSLYVGNPIRFILWGIAFACDLLTPTLTLKKQTLLPSFNLSKLPERLGLFTLIVIGETIVGVIRGVARHHHFSFKIMSEGIMGVAISFALWWIYFDYIAKRPPKSQPKLVFLWSYLHLILVMSIGVVGASLLNVLISKHHLPSDATRHLLTGSLAMSLIFMSLIEMVLKKDPREEKVLMVSTGLKFLAAIFVLFLGFFWTLDPLFSAS